MQFTINNWSFSLLCNVFHPPLLSFVAETVCVFFKFGVFAKSAFFPFFLKRGKGLFVANLKLAVELMKRLLHEMVTCWGKNVPLPSFY